MSSESTIGTRCYKIAKRLTALGIAIVPTYPGEHRAKFSDWTNQATTLMSKVDMWMNQGYALPTGLHVVTEDHNWVCVARRGGVGCLDIDNYEDASVARRRLQGRYAGRRASRPLHPHPRNDGVEQ